MARRVRSPWSPEGLVPRLFAVVAVVLGAACGSDGGPADPEPDPSTPVAARVELSAAILVFSAPGESQGLVAQVIDQRGQPMPGAPVTWTSSSPDVAEVDATGTVTAVAPGFAEITATSGAATSVATVEVRLARVGTLETLVESLEYPQGLWARDGFAYFSETASRSTIFGGVERVLRYSIASGEVEPLLDTFAPALAVASDGTLYLAAWQRSIPGEEGTLSTVDPVTVDEEVVLQLGVAATDLFLDGDGDVYVSGTSRAVDAPSLSVLVAGDPDDRIVLEEGREIHALTLGGPGLYFSESGGGVRRIVRRSQEGVLTPVLDTESQVTSLALDGEYLYFALPLENVLARIDLSDPSAEPEAVAEGLQGPITVRYDRATASLWVLTVGTSGNEFRDGTLTVIRDLR